MYLSTEEGIGRGVSPWLGPNDADNDKRLEDGYGNAWAWPFQPVYIYISIYMCKKNRSYWVGSRTACEFSFCLYDIWAKNVVTVKINQYVSKLVCLPSDWTRWRFRTEKEPVNQTTSAFRCTSACCFIVALGKCYYCIRSLLVQYCSWLGRYFLFVPHFAFEENPLNAGRR